ncbi:MAG TPA: methyltransferase [Clostridiales bacterium]|jgi:tRNA1(Val) A37 N6-methylase TrmN6|nr:methyltransferase [Clostridiales bacterium]HRT81686.1 methyltransferase [Oscillospiraceae bacterium]
MRYKKEYLGSGVYAVISKEHGFGTDALLLAYFSQAKRKDKACDLGTGCGIIPLLWCREGATKSITAVDIQPQAIEQLEKGIRLSGLEGKIEALVADLKEIEAYLPKGSFDLVSMNPPYKAENRGIKSEDRAELIARHEFACSLDDVARAASYLLRFGGRFCLCQRPERLGEIFSAMKCYGIEPKRMRLVCQTPDRAPWLVLVEGRLGGNPGMIIEKNLFIKTESGENSPEMMEAFGTYYENEFRKPAETNMKESGENNI